MTFCNRICGCLFGVLLSVLLTPGSFADEALTRVAFGSCADQNRDQGFWQVLQEESPDLFIFAGDNVYGDVSGPKMTELAGAYARLDRHIEYQDFKAVTQIIATWDDHDYGRNDAGIGFPYKTAAESLFETFFDAAPGSARNERPGVYDSWMVGDVGRRLQIILLDTRFFRDDLQPTDRRNAPGKERYIPDTTPGKSMLGPAQWSWLAIQLKMPADVRLIVSSIQVIADGHGFERWGNLPLERDRLFALISETDANGVVLLSGDRHRAGIYKRDGSTPYPMYEITSSSLNRPFPGNEPGVHRLGDMFGEPNYGVVEIDWVRSFVRLQIKDMTGRPVREISVPLAALQTIP